MKIGKLFRSYTLKSGDVDVEKRTVALSFSSEEPVERWFGTEILDHSETSVDLSRLNDGAAVLVDHEGDQVGVVEDAEVKDRRGFALIRFSKGKRASEVFNDIVDEIRRNISVGYIIKSFEITEADKENKIYRATEWMPVELSVVGVPADATVGVGRDYRDFETVVKEVKKPENPEAKRLLKENEEKLSARLNKIKFFTNDYRKQKSC